MNCKEIIILFIYKKSGLIIQSRCEVLYVDFCIVLSRTNVKFCMYILCSFIQRKCCFLLKNLYCFRCAFMQITDLFLFFHGNKNFGMSVLSSVSVCRHIFFYSNLSSIWLILLDNHFWHKMKVWNNYGDLPLPVFKQ